jgi:hypothetical protein
MSPVLGVMCRRPSTQASSFRTMLTEKFAEFIRAEMPGQVGKVHDTDAGTGGQQAAFLYHLHARVIPKGPLPICCGQDQQNSRFAAL